MSATEKHDNRGFLTGGRPGPTRRLINYFVRGLVLVVPLALTIYVCWVVFERIDSWLGFRITGLGFVVTVALITLIGFLGSNLITRGIVSLVDSALGRLPFVRLLYTSTKDLLNAFVGEKRRFDKPVLVRLHQTGEARVVGFVTQSSLERLGLPGYSAVYIPQSYNFAGNLLLFPTSQIEPIAAGSTEVMAFIVSGGVSGVGTTSTTSTTSTTIATNAAANAATSTASPPAAT